MSSSECVAVDRERGAQLDGGVSCQLDHHLALLCVQPATLCSITKNTITFIVENQATVQRGDQGWSHLITHLYFSVKLKQEESVGAGELAHANIRWSREVCEYSGV